VCKAAKVEIYNSKIYSKYIKCNKINTIKCISDDFFPLVSYYGRRN